jgi:hypothetical protein
MVWLPNWSAVRIHHSGSDADLLPLGLLVPCSPESSHLARPFWALRAFRHQGRQQHAHAERDGDRGDDQARGGFPAAAQGEAQAEADHETALLCASEFTLPSRTMTSRSA